MDFVHKIYKKVSTDPSSLSLSDIPAFWKSKYFYIGFAVGSLSLLYVRRQVQGYWRDRNAIVSLQDLSGKTAIVTGGNSGIGLGAAILLAKRNATIIIACRDSKRAANAVDYIKQQSGNNNVSSMSLDLADLKSVERFASDVATNESIDIDYLILNAGLSSAASTKDGLNMCFQVNYLAHFYLTNLLLERVKQTALKRWKLCANRDGVPVRIISVSSGAHSSAAIPMKNAAFANMAKMTCTYGQSKLLQVVHMKELQKKLHAFDQQIQCLSCTPGLVRTAVVSKFASRSLGRSMFVYPVWLAMYPVWWYLSRDYLTGAQVVLHACTNMDTVNGAYYSNCTLKKSKGENDCSNDTTVWKYAWDRSEALIQSLRNNTFS